MHFYNLQLILAEKLKVILIFTPKLYQKALIVRSPLHTAAL